MPLAPCHTSFTPMSVHVFVTLSFSSRVNPVCTGCQDEEILTDACWALSYMSDGNNDKIQAVLEAGVTRRLVELLMHPSPAVQTPALRTIGNIVTGDDLQTQIVLNAGALPCLLTLMSSHKKSIRKETCWTISNITAGNKDQIQVRVTFGNPARCHQPLCVCVLIFDLAVRD